MPVAKTSALASPPVQEVPLKTRLLAESGFAASLDRRRGPRDRHRFARERGHVDLERPIEDAGVGRDPLALLQQEHVSGNELSRLDHGALSVAKDECLEREVLLERLHGFLGLLLLHEGEERIEPDHGDDRAGEDGGACYERERCRQPEQKRERVHELLDELLRPASFGSAFKHIRAVRDEPARGLAARKPPGAGSEVAEENLGELRGVDGRARRSVERVDRRLSHGRVGVRSLSEAHAGPEADPPGARP